MGPMTLPEICFLPAGVSLFWGWGEAIFLLSISTNVSIMKLQFQLQNKFGVHDLPDLEMPSIHCSSSSGRFLSSNADVY